MNMHGPQILGLIDKVFDTEIDESPDDFPGLVIT